MDRLKLANSLISKYNITDEDIKQDLYVFALENPNISYELFENETRSKILETSTIDKISINEIDKYYYYCINTD